MAAKPYRESRLKEVVLRIFRKLSIVGIVAALMTALQGCTLEDAARALLVILALMLGAGGVAGTQGGVPEAEASIVSRIDGIIINTDGGTSLHSIPSGVNVVVVSCEHPTLNLNSISFVVGQVGEERATSSSTQSPYTVNVMMDSFEIRETNASSASGGQRLDCSVVFI